MSFVGNFTKCNKRQQFVLLESKFISFTPRSLCFLFAPAMWQVHSTPTINFAHGNSSATGPRQQHWQFPLFLTSCDAHNNLSWMKSKIHRLTVVCLSHTRSSCTCGQKKIVFLRSRWPEWQNIISPPLRPSSATAFTRMGRTNGQPENILPLDTCSHQQQFID